MRRLSTLGSRWHIAALTCFAVAALLAAFSRTIADPDLWGHLKFGQDLLSTGQVIRPDPYSYMTGDQTWINHEWLAEVIFALTYRAAGSRGLIGLKLLAALGIFGLIYACLRDLHLAPLRAWILVMLGTIPIYVGLATVRPHLFTYLCFALLMFVLWQAERGRTRWLWVLPLLFALWPNLHGGFLAGVGILLLWLLIGLFELVLSGRGPQLPQLRSGSFAASRSALRTALMAVALALLATLVNPYGIGLWTFLLRTATVPRPEITEWVPLELASVPGGVYLLLLLVGIAGFALSRHRPRPFVILAFALLALLPLVAGRHLPLFAVAMPFLTGAFVADVWERWSASRRWAGGDAGSHPIFRPMLTGVFVLGTAVLIVMVSSRAGCISVDAKTYPVQAVALLKAARAEGAIAVDFDWGEYLIWHLGPAVRVSLDGRRETVYSEPRYQDGLNFMFGWKAWDAVLQRDGVEMALVKTQLAADNLLRQREEWEPVYEDPASVLFVRRSSSLAAQLKAAAPPESLPGTSRLCFP
jgi:hypothetical protein